MVKYFLAGRVNSEEYTICERLLDILQATLPDFQVAKTPYRPETWPAEAAELVRLYGYRAIAVDATLRRRGLITASIVVRSSSFTCPRASQQIICDVIVWTDAARLVATDADAFSTIALATYGVQLDLSDSELMLYTKANVDELRQQHRQRKPVIARGAAK
ncbi:hypothetical protein P43SY_006410 [Pythium insidiosum]|uniref:Uncharacterized protein n=1 Tax=Pythium insidiosum TaxID=114742 RepID=A0AAD5LRY8_PYTIN|nr:hypothetical protein P43SY_006410 [Pythium insidiosum]